MEDAQIGLFITWLGYTDPLLVKITLQVVRFHWKKLKGWRDCRWSCLENSWDSWQLHSHLSWREGHCAKFILEQLPCSLDSDMFKFHSAHCDCPMGMHGNICKHTVKVSKQLHPLLEKCSSRVWENQQKFCWFPMRVRNTWLRIRINRIMLVAVVT